MKDVAFAATVAVPPLTLSVSTSPVPVSRPLMVPPTVTVTGPPLLLLPLLLLLLPLLLLLLLELLLLELLLLLLTAVTKLVSAAVGAFNPRTLGA